MLCWYILSQQNQLFMLVFVKPLFFLPMFCPICHEPPIPFLYIYIYFVYNTFLYYKIKSKYLTLFGYIWRQKPSNILSSIYFQIYDYVQFSRTLHWKSIWAIRWNINFKHATHKFYTMACRKSLGTKGGDIEKGKDNKIQIYIRN